MILSSSPVVTGSMRTKLIYVAVELEADHLDTLEIADARISRDRGKGRGAGR